MANSFKTKQAGKTVTTRIPDGWSPDTSKTVVVGKKTSGNVLNAPVSRVQVTRGKPKTVIVRQ